jgi:hypothetical protein
VFLKPPSRELARKIQELGSEALTNQGELAPWLTAVAAWESGEVAAAFRLAEENLHKEPDDFRMLLICLDYNIKTRDSPQIRSYAERLLKARNPAKWSRRMYYTFCIVLFPLRLLGYGKALKDEADAYDEWIAWAKSYVDSVRGGI